jgi:hypothetical protein
MCEEEGVDGEEESRSEGEAMPLVPLPPLPPLPERERGGKEAASRSSTPSAAC